MEYSRRGGGTVGDAGWGNLDRKTRVPHVLSDQILIMIPGSQNRTRAL